MAAVGVHIAVERLVDIAAGAPATEAEVTDIRFARTAAGIRREERHARLQRLHRRAVQWLLLLAMTVAALNFLACLGYALFSVAGNAGTP